MDTLEARFRLRELAYHGLELVQRFGGELSPTYEESATVRDSASEARSLLADAGYPGERAWRALDRAASALIARDPDPEGQRWRPIADELREAVEQLDSLLGSGQRDADFRIVG